MDISLFMYFIKHVGPKISETGNILRSADYIEVLQFFVF